MSLVNSSLVRPGRPAPPAGPMVRTMQWGQHLIVVVLTVTAVVRAYGVDRQAGAAAALAGLAIFIWHALGTLLPVTTHSPRRAQWWLIGFALVWVAAVWVSSEFIWLAFMLWLLAGHVLPLGAGVTFSALVFAVVVAAPLMHHGDTSYANVFGPLIGGFFAFVISRGYLHLLREAEERERLVDSLTRAQHEMAELQDELALAQRESGAIAERTRISRDIHDTIAQTLSSIRLLAHAELGRGGDATRTLEQVETMATDCLADVRRIVAALVPAELENDALATALRRMVDRLREETGMEAELHVDAPLPLLPTDVEVALLRAAQSALANVRLHSGASRMVMSLIDADDNVRLDIIDDGSGFDVEAWEAEGKASSSYGLRFMQGRLRELGGGVDIESTVGDGTAVSIYLPLRPEEAS